MFKDLLKILAAVSVAAISGTALADSSYPSRAITIVVPFPAGGALDAVARPLADEMRSSLGQPVIVENRAGAGGTMGSNTVAKAAADGYMILLGSVATHAIASGLYPKLPYDPVNGFAPITQLTRSPLVLVAGPRLMAGSVKDLVTAAKAKPGTLNYGSTGNGTALHISGELFKSAAGIDVQHIAYRGGPQAITALMGGEVDYMFANAQLVLPHIRGGKLRALAVTGNKRLSVLSEVPTVAEAGVRGVDLTTWFGFFAPAGTPKDVVAKLNSAATRALGKTVVKAQIISMGEEPVGSTPTEFTQFARVENKRWVDTVRAAKITLD